MRPTPLAPLLLLLFLPSATAAAEVPAAALTLDAIFAEPGLVTPGPENLRWSPDSSSLSGFLAEGGDARGDLIAFDARSGRRTVLVPREKLAPPERGEAPSAAAAREEERRRRYSVSAFEWSPDGTALLLSGGDGLLLHEFSTSTTRRLDGAAGGSDPGFSPDGSRIAFVRDHDLWVVARAGGEARRLTTGGSETLLHGELDWVYPEELDLREAYHWSPDGARIAVLEIDQSAVTKVPIVDPLKIPPEVSFQRYPKAGTANPKVRVGVVAATGGEVNWIETPGWAEYLPRVDWLDAGMLAVQYLDRAQRRLELVLVTVADGRRITVAREEDPAWVNVSDDLTALPKGELLWSSERDGRRHLLVLDRFGNVKRRLTSGERAVREVEGVDRVRGWVYFSALEVGTVESHLFRVPLAGGAVERVTGLGAGHRVVLAPDASAALVVSSTRRSPPVWEVLRFGRRGAPEKVRIAESRFTAAVEIPPVEDFEFRSADGALVRASLQRPPRRADAAKVPVVVHVYGGPQGPVIREGWGRSASLWTALMVQRGFAMVHVDDRTSSLVGHRYEVPMKGSFGTIPLADHRLALESLFARFPELDRERVGLWGWSAGGYTTVWNLAEAPDLFRAGVAVAGLYDFRTYDTIWTERYLGLPQEEAAAYEAASAVARAGRIRGDLLIVHGASDDNVHVQNAEMLADALVRAGRPFELAVYPNRTHGLAGSATQKHLFAKMTAFFERALAPPGR